MQQNAFCETRRYAKRLIFVLIFLSGFVLAWCEPTAKTENDSALTVSIGYISTSGNSETTTGNFKSNYHTKWGRLHFRVYGSYLFTDVTNLETGVKSRNTERIEAGIKSDYTIRDKNSFFTNISWRKDEPSGIYSNLSLASGYGFTFLDSSQSKLKGGVGLEGFREEKIVAATHISNSALAIYFQVDYQLHFNRNNLMKFSNESRMSLSDNNDYRLASTVSYVSAINHTLALEFSYQHDYKNVPVDDKRKADTTTTISLVFRF